MRILAIVLMMLATSASAQTFEEVDSNQDGKLTWEELENMAWTKGAECGELMVLNVNMFKHLFLYPRYVNADRDKDQMLDSTEYDPVFYVDVCP